MRLVSPVIMGMAFWTAKPRACDSCCRFRRFGRRNTLGNYSVWLGIVRLYKVEWNSFSFKKFWRFE